MARTSQVEEIDDPPESVPDHRAGRLDGRLQFTGGRGEMGKR
jgi:hypothetical protein